jgi:hypothetical protein
MNSKLLYMNSSVKKLDTDVSVGHVLYTSFGRLSCAFLIGPAFFFFPILWFIFVWFVYTSALEVIPPCVIACLFTVHVFHRRSYNYFEKDFGTVVLWLECIWAHTSYLMPHPFNCNSYDVRCRSQEIFNLEGNIF